jgi:type I restriction enzyme, S subunit
MSNGATVLSSPADDKHAAPAAGLHNGRRGVWGRTRLKQIVDPSRPITYGIVQCGPDVDGGVPYIRPVDMLDERGVPANRVLQRTSPDIAAAYRRSTIASGDLVVSIGPSFGKVMMVPPGLAGANLTQGTARVAPGSGVQGRYLFWVLRSQQTSEFWDSSCSGATFRALTLGILSETPVCLPSLLEQRAIAAFLDRETAKLDALVAKKEQLLVLLEEQRTGMLRENISSIMGQSAHAWLRVQLRRVVGKFVDYRGQTPEKVAAGVPLVTAANVKAGRIELSLSPSFISEDLYSEWMVRGLPEPGDVLITTEAPLGEVGIIEDPNVALAQRLVLLKPETSRVLPEYLALYLQSPPAQAELASRATGSTAIGIKASHLRAIPVVVPPLSEQQRIVTTFQTECTRHTGLSDRVSRGIAVLNEYRSALITAAVTGQIDVRGPVPDLEPAA